MIAKITRGSGFRGTLVYTLAPEHQPEIVGGNMAGENARDLAREFAAVRQLRPDVEKPVIHTSLSFDPGREGRPGDRHLTHAELGRISADYLKRMGYDLDRLQWVAIHHRDKDHQHVHLVVSRIPASTGAWSTSPGSTCATGRCAGRSSAIRSTGLRMVVQTREPGVRAPTRGEDRMLRDRGLVSEKERLKGLIQEAARGRPTMTEFLERLQQRGVKVRPSLASTGYVSGISYRLDRVAVKGSQLGRAYSWKGLQQAQGVQYDPVRDRPAVEQALQRLASSQELRAAHPRTAAWACGRPGPRGGHPGSSPALRLALGSRGLSKIGRDLADDDPRRAALGIARTVAPQVVDLTWLIGKGLPAKPKPKEPEHDPPIEMEIPFWRPPDDPDRER